MNKINRILILALALIGFSCDDILEEDISDKVPVILYPMNNEQIHSNVVNFQWNAMEGADSFRLQVIAENQSVVLNELVTGTSYTAPIAPGHYQWRVRGENFAYTSPFSVNGSFSIFETDDIMSQQVILSNPVDGLYTNNSNLILNWENVSNAESYTYQLIDMTNGSELIDQQSGILETSLQLSASILAGDAKYKWKVKGVNSEGETPYAERIFYLDRTAPLQPVNLLPQDNSNQGINQQINFSWSMGSDVGTIQSDIVYIIEFSNNENFSSIIQTLNSATTSVTQSFSAAGNYYWRVRAKDLANNIGNPGAKFNFVIN